MEKEIQLQFESMLVEISTLFINLPHDQIDNKIEDAQKRICEFLDIDRSTLWQIDENESETFLLTHIHQPPGSRTAPEKMRLHDYWPWILKRLYNGETVAIATLDDLPTEAVLDRESLTFYGAKSGVYIPLSAGQGPVIGALSFATMHKEREWSQGLLDSIVILAQVFASALVRKKTEIALLESEARLLMITTAAKAGLWSMDIDTGSVWVSDKIRDLFHFDPDKKLNSEMFSRVIHSEDRKDVDQTVSQAIQSGENFQCEFRIVLPDEEIRWITARGQRHNGSNGRSYFMGISLDITVAKQAEQEREVYRKFEKLLTDISARFANLSFDSLDTEIENAQRCICELLDLDRVALWQRSDAPPHRFKLTHNYNYQGGPQDVKLTEEHYPWCAQQMLSGKVVSFSSIEDIPVEAVTDRETYRLSGLKSNLTIPLSLGDNRIVGALGFNTTRSERAWSEEVVKRLQLVAEIITNAIERKRMDTLRRKDLLEIKKLKNQLQKENIYLQNEVKHLAEHSGIIGKSAAIKNILAQAEQVANSDSTVLLLGETGTGKELLARHIHNVSPRSERPLVTINCATIPSSLIENELFGREEGAYTGAMTKMIGRFELANGSTLFLDEIGELPLSLQSKLLRVLEEGTFERLGSTKTVNVNTRIIAATNRNLEQEIVDGNFRQDLFYRLNVFPILIPPLRDRIEDIHPLTISFISEFETILGKQIDRIPHNNMQALKSYAWPGNVRELKNVIERAMILTQDKSLATQLPRSVSSVKETTYSLDDIMRREILSVLEKTQWRIAGQNGAASLLGLKRTTLYSKMKKLGINSPAPNVDI